jgi:hypothetical protein
VAAERAVIGFRHPESSAWLVLRIISLLVSRLISQHWRQPADRLTRADIRQLTMPDGFASRL